MDEIERLSDEAAGLEGSLAGAAGMAAAFDAELKRVSGTFSAADHGLGKLEKSLSKGLAKAIDGVVLDGQKLSDALRDVANAMVTTAYKAAVKPVTDHVAGLMTAGVGSLLSGLGLFAEGAAFSQGRVMPFAKGGVFSGPVTFPMRGGVGLMGEAGPEAIMPLARGPDGSLGVRAGAGGGRSVSVVINVSTPDVAGFQRSQAQVAAAVGRALGRGQRNR